jgi:ATP-dependent Lhr-like helicase
MVSESTGKVTWWTYAGGRANLWLASALSSLRNSVVATDGLSISLDPGTNVADLQRVLAATNWSSVDVASWVSQDAIDQLKFSDAIPRELALQEVVSRLRDDESRDAAVSERVISITTA